MQPATSPRVFVDLYDQIQIVFLLGPIAEFQHFRKLIRGINVEYRVEIFPQKAFLDSQISTFESLPMLQGMQRLEKL